VRARRAGFTLVEMVVSIGLVGLVLGSSLAVMLSGHRAFVSTSMQSSADGKARQALERVVSELATAGVGSLTVDPSGPTAATRSPSCPWSTWSPA
jgi:type II secretory pathway pseudopilin PulG